MSTRLASDVPTTMRAARLSSGGVPETLCLETVPVPTPGATEVLVRVHAAGLNPKDVQLSKRARRGVGSTQGIGFDVCGEVVSCGAEVRDLEPGVRVWGFLDGTRGGTAAEFAVLPRAWVSPAPSNLSMVEAAAMPLVASTALQALRDVAGLRAGERLLIKGASGGVGSAAIQVARARGAHVTALTRGNILGAPESAAADVVLDPATDPATLRGRYDVFLDCAGSTRIRAFRSLLRRGGRWITVAPHLPVFVLAPLSPMLPPGFPRFGFVIVRPRASDLSDLAALVEARGFHVPVGATFHLEQAAAAHRTLEERRVRGKVVLLISNEARESRVIP